MTNKTTSPIDLVERRVALAINNARHDYVADADWLPTEEEVAVARAAIEASGLADTITRLKAALTEIASSGSWTTTVGNVVCYEHQTRAIAREALLSLGGE